MLHTQGVAIGSSTHRLLWFVQGHRFRGGSLRATAVFGGCRALRLASSIFLGASNIRGLVIDPKFKGSYYKDTDKKGPEFIEPAFSCLRGKRRALLTLTVVGWRRCLRPKSGAAGFDAPRQQKRNSNRKSLTLAARSMQGKPCFQSSVWTFPYLALVSELLSNIVPQSQPRQPHMLVWQANGICMSPVTQKDRVLQQSNPGRGPKRH